MTADGADFIPEVDLLRRYETMIDTQVETINGIDDKAEFTARLVGLLGGLLLTAASIGVTADRLAFTSDAVVPIVAVLLGSILLVISHSSTARKPTALAVGGSRYAPYHKGQQQLVEFRY